MRVHCKSSLRKGEDAISQVKNLTGLTGLTGFMMLKIIYFKPVNHLYPVKKDYLQDSLFLQRHSVRNFAMHPIMIITIL